MNERAQRLHDLLGKWVGLLGMSGVQRVPADKAPAALALIEHQLVEAHGEGVITGYQIEHSTQIDGVQQVRITVGIPTVLDRITVSVTKSGGSAQ